MIVVLVTRFVRFEAQYQRVKRQGDVTYFPTGIGFRLLFRLGSTLMVFAGYMVSREAQGTANLAIAGIGVCLGIGCALVEPGEIVVTPEALVQTFWFGLKKVRLPWENAAARYTRDLREVRVVNRRQTAITIVHTEYHVGQVQFLTQLKHHEVFTQGI